MDLFDSAADKGRGYAHMESKACACRASQTAFAAETRKHDGVLDTACQTAGGIPSLCKCPKGGSSIVPFNAEQAASPQWIVSLLELLPVSIVFVDSWSTGTSVPISTD